MEQTDIRDKLACALDDGVSPAEVAVRADVSYSTVARVIKGGTLPSWRLRAAIDRAIDDAAMAMKMRRYIQGVVARWDDDKRSALAVKIGVSTATVRNWAGGQLPPWRRVTMTLKAVDRIDSE